MGAFQYGGFVAGYLNDMAIHVIRYDIVSHQGRHPESVMLISF